MIYCWGFSITKKPISNDVKDSEELHNRMNRKPEDVCSKHNFLRRRSNSESLNASCHSVIHACPLPTALCDSGDLDPAHPIHVPLPPPPPCDSGDLDPAHPIFHDPALGEVCVITTASGRDRLTARLSLLGHAVGEAPSDQGSVVGASSSSDQQRGRYEVYRVGSTLSGGSTASDDDAARYSNNTDVSHDTMRVQAPETPSTSHLYYKHYETSDPRLTDE